ncbi:MAG: DUF692 domain-containing protein [Nocardiaceae bacterium]|nr:DUF692 domain-containing protein [Nocardiaceae bacterium]
MRRVSPLGPPSVGIGWRSEIAGIIDELADLSFCEVIAENLHQHKREMHVPLELTRLRSRGVNVIPHGIGLSLGGAEPVDPKRIAHLAACAEALSAPLVSEHISFVRAGGVEAGHLLPVPRTRDSLDVLTANIKQVQAELSVPLALENVAALFDWPDAEYTDAEFLTELVESTGIYLLLDIANIYANSRNRGMDPIAELASMPLDRVAYCHVAGGRLQGGRYHDTHTDRVPEEVLAMIREISTPPPLMLELDGNFPAASDILGELDAISDAARLPRITAGTSWSVQ